MDIRQHKFIPIVVFIAAFLSLGLGLSISVKEATVED